MSSINALLLFTLVCIGCRSSAEPATASQDMSHVPAPTAPSEQHAWLGQLVGDWDVTAEADMGPDVQPAVFEGRTMARWMGGLWVLIEGRMPDYGSLMTLGYDPTRGGYVGTWVDSMLPTLWNYSGTIEEDGRALVLSAEGPNPADPLRLMQFRDTFRVLSPDHLQLNSARQNDDGTWTEFMTADYHRRK